METQNLLSLINNEINDFNTKQIQVVPGFYFNQRELLETIYFYYNSKYKSGEIDKDGDRKYFLNIVKNPCKVCTKGIDFDTKHINILTAAGQDELKTWLFERDLKFWMKDKQFGKVLNRIFNELPIFGSVVLKVINNVPYFIDLRNFYCTQSADTLLDANFITEMHRYTIPQFRKVARDMGWNDVEKTISEFRKMNKTRFIEVFERYGEIEKDEGGGKKSYEYKKVFVANVGVDEYDQEQRKQVDRTGVILKEVVITPDEIPYWEFHLEKLPGRWLGYGTVEGLIEPQIRQNEIANLEAKGSYWSALRLFQTRDTTLKKNLMRDVDNGDVVNSESEITPVNTTDPNLSYFQNQTAKWMQNRDELSFSYDVVQGERLPSGTPLGSAKIAANMAMSYFDQLRENIALDIKEFLYSVIIPNFEKESSKEHILRIVGEDLDKLRDVILKQKTNDAIIKFIAKKRKIPDQAQLELLKTALKEEVNQGKELLTSIPKGFYTGIKYAIDIIITGESKDTAIYAQTIFAALQAITADPMLLSDPNKKKFFYKYLEAGGVNPNDFIETIKEDNPMMNQMPEPFKGAGGGVSRPAPMPQESMQQTV